MVYYRVYNNNIITYHKGTINGPDNPQAFCAHQYPIACLILNREHKNEQFKRRQMDWLDYPRRRKA